MEFPTCSNIRTHFYECLSYSFLFFIYLSRDTTMASSLHAIEIQLLYPFYKAYHARDIFGTKLSGISRSNHERSSSFIHFFFYYLSTIHSLSKKAFLIATFILFLFYFSLSLPLSFFLL